MCPSPWRSASRRARSSVTGERSTAVTDPGRRASGSASRPGPHPYSRTDIGANCGDRPASMTASIHDTTASPLAKNSRSCPGVRLARRNLGSVRTAKYGSRAANASQRGSGLVNTCSIDPQREVALVRGAGRAGHEELRALDDHVAVGTIEEIGGQSYRLIEVR